MLYRAISQQSADEMAAKVATYRAEGYRKFQLKVGGDPNTDIERIRAVAELMQSGDVLIADANTGWLMHQAAASSVVCAMWMSTLSSPVSHIRNASRSVSVQITRCSRRDD